LGLKANNLPQRTQRTQRKNLKINTNSRTNKYAKTQADFDKRSLGFGNLDFGFNIFNFSVFSVAKMR
jgi:hypothetical protein